MPDPKLDRAAGRSFDDPSRPLGDDLLRRALASDEEYRDELYDRVRYDSGGPPLERPHVAERAIAVAVLRKAEELMRTKSPPAKTAAGVRRAFELAAGRVGVRLREYEQIVRDDPELLALERRVIDDAARRERQGSRAP